MGTRVPGLNFTARLDTAQAIKDSEAFIKELNKLKQAAGVSSISLEPNSKPLTEYQKKLLELKKQAIDNEAANKRASLATQEALQNERLALIEINKQRAKNLLTQQEQAITSKAQAQAEKELAAQANVRKPTQFSNSQAEIDAYNDLANGSREVTSTINEQDKAQAALANTAAASTAAINSNADATKKAILTKKEMVLQAERDKQAQAENTAAIKLQAKEMNAAKGSLDQRRAALTRLQRAFDSLNVTERNSPAGQRLGNIVSNLSTQVKELEASTGRAQRNVGNYGNAFTNAIKGGFSWLRKIALLLPGIGAAGILAFATGPIIDWVIQLGIFSEKLTQLKANYMAYNEVQKSANQESSKQISNLKILYTAATDVKNSMNDRVAAAQALKREYPDSFANSSTMAILNGKEKESYDLLTGSILEQAKARAAASKISDIEAKKQDAEFTKQKIDAKRANDLAAYAVFQKQNAINYKNGSSFLKPGSIQDVANVQKIKDDATAAYKVQNDLIKILDGQEAFLTKYAGGNQKIADVITGGNNLIKDPLKNFDSIIKNASQKADIDNLRESLQAKLDALAPNDKQRAEIADKLKQLEVIEKKYAPKTSDDKKVESDTQVELNARNTLQKKIDELQRGSVIKAEDADQKEVDSVKEKYVQIRKEIERFYADQKKKGTNFKVNTSGLNASEKAETDAVVYKQQAKKQLESLDLQKKQYVEYEQYVTDFGADMAQKRFGKEIADNKNYLKKLQDEAAKINIIPYDQRTGGQTDYLIELNKRIAVEVDAQKQKYDKLIKQLQSYQDQAKSITDQYNSDKDTLATNPLNLNSDQLAEQYKKLEENYRNAISDISVKELNNSKDWTDLFSNLDNIATDNLDKLITTIKGKSKELSRNFNPVDLDAIQEKLEKAKQELIDRNPFKAVGKAIQGIFSDGADGAKKSTQDIKEEWDSLGKSTAASFKFVEDAVQSCDILKYAIGDVGATAIQSLITISTVAIAVTTAIKTAEKASVILAVISAALAVVQAVAGVIKSIFNAGDKRIENKIKGYKAEIELLDAAFKELDRDVANAAGNDIYAYQAEEIDNLTEKQAKLIQARDAEASKKHADQSKIDEYNSQIADIPNQIDDINKAISQELIQGTFRSLSDSLADALTSAFQAGEDGIDAMDKTFNDFIGNVIKNSLKLVIFDKDIKSFTDDLTAYAKANNNSVVGYDFSKWDSVFKNDGLEFDEALKANSKYFPSTTNADSSSPSTLTADVKSITEDTASIISGTLHGMQLAQIETNNLLKPIGSNIGELFQIAKGNFELQVKIEANTYRTADNTQNLIPALKRIEDKIAANANALAANGRIP